MNEKAAKPETVKQNDDKTWSYLHPVTGEWCSKFPDGAPIKKRDDARKERVALTPAKSKKSAPAQSTTNEQTQETGKTEDGTKNAVDSAVVPAVESSAATTSNEATSSENITGDVAQQEKSVMASLALTLDPKTRKSTSVVFKLPSGIRGSVRIAKTAFPGGVPPTSLNLQSDAENAFAGAKPKLTPEQRKEARKNAPKLTPAEKLAKLQERAAKLQAKIAAGTQAATAPAGESAAQ